LISCEHRKIGVEPLYSQARLAGWLH